MEKRFYCIAGTYLLMEAQKSCFPEELADFEIKIKSLAADIRDFSEKNPVRVVCTIGEPFWENEVLLETEQISVYETEQSFWLRYHGLPGIKACYLEKKAQYAKIYLAEAECPPGNISYVLRDIFFFYLQRCGKVVIHSASVLYRERVWLFAAPSGTGKSTHVRYWFENQYPAEHFNGDLAVCYLENGRVMAASTPWCGSSGIYCNKAAPLGGILFLKRGDANGVRRLKTSEGILRMSARTVSPAWNVQQVKQNLTVCEQLSEKLVLAELTCRMEKEAAIASKEYIDGLGFD